MNHEQERAGIRNFNPRGTETQRNNFSLATGAVDLASASLSTAAARLSGNSSFGTGLASGIKWAATGVNELTNHGEDYSHVQRAINTTNSLAGLTNTASTLSSHFTASDSDSAIGLGYSSAGFWGFSALLNTGKGIQNSYKAYKDARENGSGAIETASKMGSGIFQAMSGGLNMAAAVYSAEAVRSSSRNDDTGAARNATISSALWMGGAVTGMISTYLARPPRAAVADLEAGHPPPRAELPVQKSVTRALSQPILSVNEHTPLAPQRPRAQSMTANHGHTFPVI